MNKYLGSTVAKWNNQVLLNQGKDVYSRTTANIMANRNLGLVNSLNFFHRHPGRGMG